MKRDPVKCHVWEMTKRLWNKYIGISDDFRMLKDKWTYLSPHLEPALPHIDATFEKLDSVIRKVDRLFLRYFNLKRNVRERFRDFKVASADQYSKVEDAVSNLATYVGMLKFAFFQRTVSLEIPQVTSGYPHSPERTAGNEIIYIAADRMTSSYIDSIKPSPEGFPKWDGFMTFVPAITEEIRHGAFLKRTPYGLYHIYLPEASKYSLSSYLLLAHEIGHVAFWEFRNQKWTRKREYDEIRNSLHSVAKKHAEDYQIKNQNKCKSCGTGFLGSEETLEHLVGEILADVVALKIGGSKTIEALLNETPFREDRFSISESSFETLARVHSISYYMSGHRGRYRRQGILKLRLIGLDKHLRKYAKSEDCKNCASSLGERIGNELTSLEKDNPEVFNQFLSDDGEFMLDHRDEKDLMACLKRDEPCPQVDPRQIVHCYFTISQSAGEERAPLSATLQSLAYNESE